MLLWFLRWSLYHLRFSWSVFHPISVDSFSDYEFSLQVSLMPTTALYVISLTTDDPYSFSCS